MTEDVQFLFFHDQKNLKKFYLFLQEQHSWLEYSGMEKCRSNSHNFPVVSMWNNHTFDGKGVAENLQWVHT